MARELEIEIESQVNSNEGETSHRRRPMQRVPQLLRKEKHAQDYIPKVVSIGPYHHGKPELRLAESFKPLTVEMVLSGEKEKQDYYYKEIRERITDIRNCYEKEATDSYSDDELARMMFLDASFIIIHIETRCEVPDRRPEHLSDHQEMLDSSLASIHALGLLNISCMIPDMFLLENQIPLWVVKLLLKSRYEENQIQELLDSYLIASVFVEVRFNRKVRTESSEDLNLLEAFRRLLVFGFISRPKKTCLSFIKCKFLCFWRAKEKTDLKSGVSSQGKSRFRSCMNDLIAKACRRLFKNCSEGDPAIEDFNIFSHSFRSVTELKASGIFFKPSRTLSLEDVMFKSYCLYATLQLPICFFSPYTKILFLNMIAYELSPNLQHIQPVVTSYISFMKSLIVKPKDVKELRENKILICSLTDDAQIVSMYQDINTYGIDYYTFGNVKDEIQAHYNCRTKTWIADLIHIYFRNPWSFAALFAASCILVLTILQTVYAMKSYFEDR